MCGCPPHSNDKPHEYPLQEGYFRIVSRKFPWVVVAASSYEIKGEHFMITWKDTIAIIIQTYECKQKELADLLGVSTTFLSKAKAGDRDVSEYFEDEYSFKRIFDVNTSGSLAYRKDEKELLDNMKFIICGKFTNVMYAMEDCWDDANYQTFILKLLERTRRMPVENRKNIQFELCHILPEKPLLFGREDELSKISEIFDWSNYVVLTGIGGIGKSQLALSYAHTLNVKGDWTIQHIICEDSELLQQALCKLQFTDFPEGTGADRPSEVISRLKANEQKALIILDNLNHPFSDYDYQLFQKLVKCNVQVLITSRYPLIKDKRHLIHVASLDDDLLLKLYEYYRFEDSSDHSSYITNSEATLKQIFPLIERHTLMVTLLAKLPERCFLDERAILEMLKTGLPLPMECVDIELNGRQIESTIYEIIKKLFDISKLSKQEKSILFCMICVPNNGIDVEMFRDLANCIRKDIVSLKKRQWITVDEETHIIRLHPLICEAILAMDETKDFWHMSTNQTDPQIITDDEGHGAGDMDNDDDTEVDEDCDVTSEGYTKGEPDDDSIKKLASSFENASARGFIRRVLKKRSELPQESPPWQTLNQIVASFAAKVIFRQFGDFLSYAKSEYQEPIFKFNKKLTAYTTTDSESQKFIIQKRSTKRTD